MLSPFGSKPCKHLSSFIKSTVFPILKILRLRLFRQTANDPNLVGLLRVFKNYYPEIIVGDVTKGRAATFKVGKSQ